MASITKAGIIFTFKGFMQTQEAFSAHNVDFIIEKDNLKFEILWSPNPVLLKFSPSGYI